MYDKIHYKFEKKKKHKKKKEKIKKKIIKKKKKQTKTNILHAATKAWHSQINKYVKKGKKKHQKNLGKRGYYTRTWDELLCFSKYYNPFANIHMI